MNCSSSAWKCATASTIVFTRYDPGNLLLGQARREVLEHQLEIRRLGATIAGVSEMKIVHVELDRLTQLAFPLWASFVQASVTTEKWSERVKRVALQLESLAARKR